MSVLQRASHIKGPAAAEMVLYGLGHCLADRPLTRVHKSHTSFCYIILSKDINNKKKARERGWHTLVPAHHSADAWMCHGRFLLRASTPYCVCRILTEPGLGPMPSGTRAPSLQ